MVSFFCSIKYFHEPTELTSPMLQLMKSSASVILIFGISDCLMLTWASIWGLVLLLLDPTILENLLCRIFQPVMAPTGGEVRRRQQLRIGRHSRHLEDLLTMEVITQKLLLRQTKSRTLIPFCLMVALKNLLLLSFKLFFYFCHSFLDFYLFSNIKFESSLFCFPYLDQNDLIIK